MINLINSELYKLKKSKVFKICILLSLIVSLILIATSTNSNILIQTIFQQDLFDKLMDDYFKQYMTSLTIMGVGTGWNPTNMNTVTPIDYTVNSIGFAAPISIIFSIFISIFITSENSNGAIKNIISKGYSRTAIYISKLIVMSISSILILYTFLFTSFITSSAINGFKAVNSNDFYTLICFLMYQSIVHISIASIFTMFAIISKSVLVSLLINIFLLPMITSAFQLIAIFFHINVYSFWISTCSTVFNNLNITKYDIFKGLVLASIYLIVSTSVGICIFKNQDIDG